jgi:hypothetical protein
MELHGPPGNTQGAGIETRAVHYEPKIAYFGTSGLNASMWPFSMRDDGCARCAISHVATIGLGRNMPP